MINYVQLESSTFWHDTVHLLYTGYRIARLLFTQQDNDVVTGYVMFDMHIMSERASSVLEILGFTMEDEFKFSIPVEKIIYLSLIYDFQYTCKGTHGYYKNSNEL